MTKEILNNLDKSYKLFYVDYNESFDDNSEIISLFFEEDGVDKVREKVWESYYDDSNTVYYYIGELATKLGKEFTEEEEDFLVDAIRERDNSDPFADLLKNSSSVWAKIHIDEKELKNLMDKEELNEANYFGGEASILFTIDLSTLVEIKTNKYQGKYLKLNGEGYIGRIDTGNGGGYMGSVNFENFIIPNNPELFLEDANYSYAKDVAGLVDKGSIGVGNAKTYHEGKKLRIDKEILIEKKRKIEKDKEYQKIYNSGKCSLGDKKFTRHRNVEYINSYPCGNKCKDCGQFWID